MQRIDLTNRKKTPVQSVLGMFSRGSAENGEQYRAKFSTAYQDAGHDFNKSFKVLRGAYVFKYKLLSIRDVSVYETLQFLCTEEIPFCLERLADECGLGDATLRQSLDNLENADLLEILKTDGRGAPNFYLLRTPYFEQDSILPSGDDRQTRAAERRQNRIKRAGEELPLEFLENHVDRLRHQITRNYAKKRREMLRRNYSKSRLFARLRRQHDDRRVLWYRFVKLSGSNRDAAALESVVYKLARAIPPTDYNFSVFRSRFKEEFHLRYGTAPSLELVDAAQNLVAFFDRYQPHGHDDRRHDSSSSATRRPAPAAAQQQQHEHDDDQDAAGRPTTTTTNTAAAEVANVRARVTSFLQRYKAANPRPHPESIANQLIGQPFYSSAAWSTIEAALTDLFGAAIAKHVGDELLI